MKLIIDNKEKSEQFVHLFSNLKSITENVNIECLDDGLYIQGMDNSQICIYDLMIDKSWFTSYLNDENSVYGINMIIFSKILNIKNENQKIIIYDENDKFCVEFISEDIKEINKYFQIPLLDIDCDKMSIPKTEYDISIEFNSKIFKNIINELKDFGDVMKIYYNENIYFKSSSTESSMNVELKETNVEELTMTEDSEEIDIEFSLKYIYIFSQFHKLNKNVYINISPGIPIEIKYTFGDNSHCNFYLAPKISD
tara:strand:+ start:179 stop:940 length:762 start_codon:yes stop_codon:yes gene_type:complete